jgi:2''-aminoglycoside nucleotidyltransferase
MAGRKVEAMNQSLVETMGSHVAAIRELFDAADARGIPLWLESGWAIDARLGRITRIHDDIDIAFPHDRQADYVALIEELGYGKHEFLDYGFLSRRGAICLDSECCHEVAEGFSFHSFPPNSCPLGREGSIGEYPVRCVSWPAIYFEILGYLDEIPQAEWRPKDFESLRIVESMLDDDTKGGLQRTHSEAARESQTSQPEIVLKLDAPFGNDEIAHLFQAAWGDHAPDVPPAVDRCLAHICAYSNDRLVGFVKLAWDGGTHAFLLDTTVHPDYQRRGIGRKLVARAVEVVASSGIEWLHVDYDRPLETFYAACGFQPTTAGLIHLADRR